jgi:hypothetical protein
MCQSSLSLAGIVSSDGTFCNEKWHNAVDFAGFPPMPNYRKIETPIGFPA